MHENIRTNRTFLVTKIIDLHFAAHRMDLSSFSFFSAGLRKTVFFHKNAYSRSLIFGTNGKCSVCDFLLVRHN